MSRDGAAPAVVAARAGLLLLLAVYAWFLAMTLASRRPLWLDLSVFWTAARLAWHGQAALAYDPHAFNPLLVFLAPERPADTGPWFYPPMFFLLVAPLALLPLPAAAAAWLAATAAGLLAAVRAILPRAEAALLATLAAPAVFFNFCSGQNGLLSAALFAGGLALIERRPWVAGALLGALAYKPQFGLLLPLALIAGGRWRVIAAAAISVAGLAVAAGLLFGWRTYTGFAGELLFAQSHLLGGEKRWSELESVYGMLRALGCGGTAAWLGHGLVALPAAAATCAIWRRPAAAPLQAASLVTASFVVTPYSESSDLAILVVPMAFLIAHGLRHGVRAWEPPVLLLAYAMPFLFLFAPGLHTQSGIGPATCLLLAGLVAARLAGAGAPPRLAAIAQRPGRAG